MKCGFVLCTADNNSGIRQHSIRLSCSMLLTICFREEREKRIMESGHIGGTRAIEHFFHFFRISCVGYHFGGMPCQANKNTISKKILKTRFKNRSEPLFERFIFLFAIWPFRSAQDHFILIQLKKKHNTFVNGIENRKSRTPKTRCEKKSTWIFVVCPTRKGFTFNFFI